MLLSELLIISAAKQLLISKKYRHDIKVDTLRLFLSKLQGGKQNLLPVLSENGTYLYHIKRNDLFLVGVSKYEASSITAVEFLSRVYQLLKDFCGRVTQDSLVANIVLVHEVLDEVMDSGYVQLMSAEKLRPYIQSEPVPLRTPDTMTTGLFGIEHRVVPSDASARPVIRPQQDQEMRKNEVFIDIIERLTVVREADGNISRCEANGVVNLKSFLVGTPQIQLGFSNDLTIGRDDTHKGYGKMTNLDECSFHECVDQEEFESARMLRIQPPEGEFSVLTYSQRGRVTQGLPFRLISYVKSEVSSRDMELGLKLQCDIPGNCQAVKVVVNIPVPQSTTSISQQLSGPGQMAELVTSVKKIEWRIDKILGSSDVSAHFKLISANESPASRMQLGPVALTFEVSGCVCSSLQIRFLRVCDRDSTYIPQRWIRYITTADSYIVKL
ncbi:AP-4 complex subunit mu-1 [Lamellibrachia satsuma]|nr:AP-4 complex subunit mu-1 [Lamellibrachia satsuma]